MRCADCGQEIAEDQAACVYCGRPAHLEIVDPATTPPIRASLTAIQMGEDASPSAGTWIGKLELHGQDIFVGRLPSSDIALEGDSLVSRRHLRFYAKQGHYFIEDLYSSNGTLVNDAELIAPLMLTGGEVVRVGSFALLYESQSAEAAAEAPQATSAPAPSPLASGAREVSPSSSIGKRDSSVRAFAATGAPATRGDTSTARNPGLSDIRVLKEQVGALGKLVQQRADDEALQVETMRGALIHAYSVLSSLLDMRESTLRSTAAGAQSLAEMARQTARDPEHIFQALRFASHAGEIAVILDYLDRGGIGRDVMRTLRELHTQLGALPHVQAVSGQRQAVTARPQDERQ